MASAMAVRVHQFVDHLLPTRKAVEIPADLSRRLTPEARTTFDGLSGSDKAHLVQVATEVARVDPLDDDLIVAALLHDIGKLDERHRVRIHDRVAKVLLERLAPSMLARLTRQAAPPRGTGGLWVLGRHAEAGAALARSWGYPERVCALIGQHESRETTDVALGTLIAIDGGARAEDLLR